MSTGETYKKNIQFDTNASDVEKEINNLNDSTENLSESSDKAADSTKKLTDSQTKLAASSKSSEKSSKMSIGAIAGGMGVYSAAAAAIGYITGALMENSKVAKVMEQANLAVKLVINDFVDLCITGYDKVVGFFKAAFEDPKQALIDFGNMVEENLIERFNSFLDTLGYIGEGLKKLFSGDLSGAMSEFGNAAKESYDVLTGVNNSVDKLTDGIGTAADYFADKFTEAGKIMNESFNIEAQMKKNEGLIAKQEAENERMRQLRDASESKSIADRMKANEDLKKGIEKQAALLLENANLGIRQAELELQKSASQENQNALQEAKNKLSEVENTIAGQTSEQLAAQNGLIKEAVELKRQQAQEEFDFTQQMSDYAAKNENDPLKRLEKEIAANESLKQLKLQQQDEYISTLTVGTAAHDAALAERRSNEAEYNQKDLELRKQYSDQKTEIAKNQAQEEFDFTQQMAEYAAKNETDPLKKLEKEIAANELLKELRLNQQDEYIGTLVEGTAAYDAALAERRSLDASYGQKGIELEKQYLDAKTALAKAHRENEFNSAMDLGNSMQELAGEGTAVAKGAAVAVTVMQTYQSATAAFAGLAGMGPFGVAAGIAAAALAIKMGFDNVKRILAVPVPGKKPGPTPPPAPGGGGGSASVAAATPNVDFQRSSENQIAESIGKQNKQPIKAYVVTKDISTGQELDRNTVNNASL